MSSLNHCIKFELDVKGTKISHYYLLSSICIACLFWIEVNVEKGAYKVFFC